MRSQIAGVAAVLAVVALSAVLLRQRDRDPAPAAPPRTETAAQPPPLTHAIQPETHTARGSADAPLVFTGTVQPASQASLSARMPARILFVKARPDQPVHRGDLLVQLDDADVRAQIATAQAGVLAARAQLARAESGKNAQLIKADSDLANARAGLAQAQTKLRQAELGVDAAKQADAADLLTAQQGVSKAQAGVDTARETLRQLQALSQVGGVSRSDLDGAQTQAKIAEADLTTARAQLARLQSRTAATGADSMRVANALQDLAAAREGVRQARDGVQSAAQARRDVEDLASQDIVAARAAVAQAQAGEGAARAASGMAKMVSPIDGVVSTVSARVGETAQPGMPVVTIVSLGAPHVDALIPARQLPGLAPGKRAIIVVDTRPGHRLPAAVSAVSHVAEPDGRTFRVSFRFLAPTDLRPGQTARIAVYSGA